MSLPPMPDTGVSCETAAVAHAAFPRGHIDLSLRETLGPIYTVVQFADLFARDGQPAACPWRLTLITLLQFPEKLTPCADELVASPCHAPRLPLNGSGLNTSTKS